MRQNVVTMFGQTPAFVEPCAAMGLAPRMTPMEAYPVHLIKEFLVSVKSKKPADADVWDGFRERGNRGKGHRGYDPRRPGRWVFKPY
ncbi:hypothetical protein Aduo_015767 [Ancylostoma duodenale]